MLVNDWMNTPVITIKTTDNLQHAVDLMKNHNIGMLPVMKGGNLVGIVTDRDLKRAGPSCLEVLDLKEIVFRLTRQHIMDIMTPNPITLHPDLTLEEASEVLLTHNISGCPVLDHENELVGVITKNDLFRAMMAVTGLTKRGFQFGFLLEDRPRVVREVTGILRKYHARIVSIMSTYEDAPEGYRYVYIRAFAITREKIDELLAEIKENYKLLYMVDHRDGIRETYATY